MALIKKNIWLAFYLIVILWTGALVGSIYITYQNIYEGTESQQPSMTEMTAHTFTSLVEQQEVMLDIAAKHDSFTQALDSQQQGAA